jgi:hypothetical protein
MLHLDFEVTDLEAETQRALQLWAELASYQPQENVRVLPTLPGTPSVSTPVEDARSSA